MPPSMKDDRDIVFQRIREGLRSPRIHHASHGHPPRGEAQHAGFDAWLPPVGDGPDQWIAQFAAQSAALKTEFICCREDQLGATMIDLARLHAWQRIAWHNTSLTRVAADAVASLTGPGLEVSADYSVEEMEQADVGITGCEALVAQTGSILYSTRSAGGRALSILPPHHVALAHREQLLPDLPTAMRQIRERYGAEGNQLPSMLCLASGPSRTGDIERILVLGAHGPKKVSVILIE